MQCRQAMPPSPRHHDRAWAGAALLFLLHPAMGGVISTSQAKADPSDVLRISGGSLSLPDGGLQRNGYSPGYPRGGVRKRSAAPRPSLTSCPPRDAPERPRGLSRGGLPADVEVLGTRTAGAAQLRLPPPGAAGPSEEAPMMRTAPAPRLRHSRFQHTLLRAPTPSRNGPGRLSFRGGDGGRSACPKAPHSLLEGPTRPGPRWGFRKGWPGSREGAPGRSCFVSKLRPSHELLYVRSPLDPKVSAVPPSPPSLPFLAGPSSIKACLVRAS